MGMATDGRGYPRIFSEPVQLHWAGWRSDTLTLQRCGWDISADQDVAREEMRIAMRNQHLRLTAITELRRNWGYRLSADPYQASMRRHDQVAMQVEALGNVMVQGSMSLVEMSRRFEPIDATPQFSENWAPRRLEDLVHFATVDAKNILLPGEEVPRLMERILELQQPMRDKHFLDEARRDAAERKQIVHARLVSWG